MKIFDPRNEKGEKLVSTAVISGFENTLADVNTDILKCFEKLEIMKSWEYEYKKDWQKMDMFLTSYFDSIRTGKIYTIKINTRASGVASPSAGMVKADDNAGLICEPSTDKFEGRDDYADIPLFKWWHCNYIKTDDGTTRITAIKGAPAYREDDPATDGVDVGAMGMSFWVRYTTSADGKYQIISISDKDHNGEVINGELQTGWKVWVECKRADGSIAPYWCHSAYFGAVAADGKARSLPNLYPAQGRSYASTWDWYENASDSHYKGKGYHGANFAIYLFQVIFITIKYATKDSQSKFMGRTRNHYDKSALVHSSGIRTTLDTCIRLTKDQARNFKEGMYVHLHSGGSSRTTGESDANSSTQATNVRTCVRVLKHVPANDDGSLCDVYLNCEPFALPNSNYGIVTCFAPSGDTNCVIGHHDGSRCCNHDNEYDNLGNKIVPAYPNISSDPVSGYYPYRIQGTEYGIGIWSLAMDTVMNYNSSTGKDEVYVAPQFGVRYRDNTNQQMYNPPYTKVTEVTHGSGYVVDLMFDFDYGIFWPTEKGTSGSGSASYWADNTWAAGFVAICAVELGDRVGNGEGGFVSVAADAKIDVGVIEYKHGFRD